MLNNTGFSRGSTNAATIVARLKRDHPDIAARLANREFRSARAAGIAAGFITPTSALDALKRHWQRASDVERRAFDVWRDNQRQH